MADNTNILDGKTSKSITVFPSAERNATVVSDAIRAEVNTIAIVTIDVTAIAVGAEIILAIFNEDPESAGLYSILASPIIAGITRVTLMTGTGIANTAATANITANNVALTENWYVRVSRESAGNVTYSVGATLLKN